MGDKGGVCGLRMRNEGGGLGSELRGDEEMRVNGGGDKCGRRGEGMVGVGDEG